MRRFILVSLSLMLSACGRGKGLESRITLKFESGRFESLSASTNIAFTGTTNWGRNAAQAMDEVECLAVAISGKTGDQNACALSNGGSIKFEHAAGFVKKTETLSLSVPSGGVRAIRLVGTSAMPDGSCPSLSAIDRASLAQPRILAEVTRELVSGDMTVDMTARFTGEKILACAGPATNAVVGACDKVKDGVPSGETLATDYVRVHMASGMSATQLQSRQSLFLQSLDYRWVPLNSYQFTLKAGVSQATAVAALCADPAVQFVTAVSLEESPVSYTTAAFDNSATTASAPIVAVVDSGIYETHNVFVESGALWTNSGDNDDNGIDDDGNGFIDDNMGWNFANHSADLADSDDHGTAVAGVVLKQLVDITVDPVPTSPIRIMPLKVPFNVQLQDAAVASAILYATQNGAKVILMAFGNERHPELTRRALIYASNRGALLVAAAGNSHADNDVTPMYPASFAIPNMISVGAVDDYNLKPVFTNFGKKSVHMGAKGVSVFSTVTGDTYMSQSGTSFAAAAVAGVGAQLLLSAPQASGYQLKQMLLNSALPMAALTPYFITGGYLNGSTANSAASSFNQAYSQPQQ